MDDSTIKPGVENIISEDVQWKAATLRNNFANLAGTSPEDFAKQRALSEASGIALPHLLGNPEEAQKQRALVDTDFSGLVMKHPLTADFLSNPLNAGATRDLTSDLTAMESITAKADYLGGSTVAGLHDLAGAGAKLLDAILPTTSDQDLATLYKNDPDGLRRMRENSLSTILMRFARGQTEASNKAMKRIDPEAKALFGGLEYATLDPAKAAYLSPTKVLSDALRSLPTTAALFLTTLLTRGAAARAEAQSLASGMTVVEGHAAGVKAAVDMATKFGAASEGSIGYAQQALQTQNENEKVSLDKLAASPAYKELITRGFDPATARIYLAAKSGEIAGVGAGAADAITNAVGGRFLGKIISEGGALLPRMGKGFLSEGLVEAVQSPFEQWFQNAATQQLINPKQDLSEGLLESVVQGFVVGGVTGSAFSGVLGRSVDEERAKTGAQSIIELFTAAARLGQRSPSTLREVLNQLAPDATVLINPDKLTEVLATAGLDASVMPTAAAQLASGEITGPGIEIPVSELITGLTGTSAEKEVVQHLRLGADMPTLAEVKEHDTKAAEFFQKEAERVLEKEAENADFQEATKAVHADIFQQLREADTQRGPAAHNTQAKLASDAYAVLANRLGITPLQLRDGYVDAAGVAHRGYRLGINGPGSTGFGQGFKHGHAMLNVGLDVGTAGTEGAITEDVVKAAIEKLGVKVLSGKPVDGGWTDGDGTFHAEKAYVPHLSRKLTDDEVQQLNRELKQEAISQYADGVGMLHIQPGFEKSEANPNGWTEFDSKYFKDQDGNTLLSHQEAGLAQEMAAYRAPEKRDDQGRLLAPNGKPSNLDERQWHIVRSPQFKEWFGDWEAAAEVPGGVWGIGVDNVSKVVDDNGEPLVVYHGTRQGGFKVFRPEKADQHRTPMVFTASQRNTASTYSGTTRDITFGEEPKTQTDFEALGFEFYDNIEEVRLYDPDGNLVADGLTLEQAVKEAAAEYKQNGHSYETEAERGIYPLFLNIRNPNEANFEGANWDGTVYDKYEVWDGENEEPVYNKDSGSYFDTATDARVAIALEAERTGRSEDEFEVREATDRYETTNSVAEEAKRLGADGAIIRQVVDDGGHGGGVEVDDVFVFFKPNQAKSATQNLGTFSTTDDNTLHQQQSSRRPWTKVAPQDHMGEVPLLVDYTLIAPEKNAQNMALVAKYPGIRFKARDPAKRAEEFIQHLTANLIWLHNQVPKNIRERSKLWYDGANALSLRWAEKYNLTPAQTAAVIAAYSPQRDWFDNLSMAERMFDIVSTKQDFRWDDAMSSTADIILAKQDALLREQTQGKTFGELTTKLQQAAWIRVYDATHNNPSKRIGTPEGGFTEYAKNVGGEEGKIRWTSMANVVKALNVIEDGSATSVDKNLGADHKVRSFYNNIFHPGSDLGYVTIDTHAVAAALLRPLSAVSMEVSHNFGSNELGKPGPAQDASTGQAGTYAYYQEAYRRAAEATGLLPRELQSVTWEAVRGLYTPTFKHKKNNAVKLAALNSLWTAYEKGKPIPTVKDGKIAEGPQSAEGDPDKPDRASSLAAVRAGILGLAGGVEVPAWSAGDSGLSEGGWASTYTDELLGRGVSWRGARPNAGRGRDATAGGSSTTLDQANPLVRAGLVPAPVVGVHFSKQARPALTSSSYGTGTKGAEAERLAQSSDPRIKQRIAFYIDEGSGVHPEPGVGGAAHVATLTNLYDADADTLKLFRRNQRDLNAAESAVLDAGFDGYLQRKNFHNQGTAVLLGPRSMDAEHVGGVEEANARATIPPPAIIPEMKTLAIQFANDRSLPGGAMTAPEWEVLTAKQNPKVNKAIDWSKFDPEAQLYKDEIAGQLWQTNETWYYSQLKRAIENASDKIFTTGAGVKQWLVANAGKLGVKQAELEATGITDWLDLQPKVTKQLVVDFMQQGGVKVTEVVLGGTEGRVLSAEKAVQVALGDISRTLPPGALLGSSAMSRLLDEVSRARDGVVVAQQALAARQLPPKTQAALHTHAEKLAELEQIRAEDRPTKFPDYQLPGGQNYRELLLTLPSSHELPEGYRIVPNESTAKSANKFIVEGPDGHRYASGNTLEEATAAYLEYHHAAGEFRSSHYDQPNILAHIRFNERTDAGGARVLFVEEVQSDWGQRGKKEGFRTGAPKTEVREDENVWVVKFEDGKAVDVLKTDASNKDDAIARAIVMRNAQPNRAWHYTPEGVPVAPFVTDTKAWTGLAVKRILAYAAENGFDKVAWTTGAQQAERYDLSKQISKIEYRVSGGQNYRITVFDKNDSAWTFRDIPPSLDAKGLEDYVGKDMAQKIVDTATSETQTLSGLDLKVGGEGMHAYYDEILPQVVRDVLKKVGGGKVETVSVLAPYDLGDQYIGGKLEKIQTKPMPMPQQGFTITPEMRAMVSKGLPLFQPAPGEKLGGFHPPTLNMTLLANANLTTFEHELAHFLLTMYADIASQPGAPQQIVDDMNALLKMFGIADLATWNAMTLEQQRPHHEHLAESMEQYFFTGKAPSVELQPVFRTISAWFKKVYLSVKDFVATHAGAKLNPELSAIFDRMLATDAEIASANAARGYAALFKDAAEAGMTDKAFAAYTALDDAQREDAESMLRTRELRNMKWLQSRRNKYIAAMQADAKEKRAEMRKTVAAEVKAEPIRQAERYLKYGVILNEVGADIAPLGPNKMTIAEVKALFPEEALTPQPDWTKLNYGKYGMLVESGLSPDEVAVRFGIDSGIDLVNQLLGLQPLNSEIEARTDQAMLETYGDLSSEAAIAQAADEAICNDFHIKAVATELSALAKNIGPMGVLIKAAKEYARQVLETKTSKTLKPWSYAAAATRARKAAKAALAKGDRQQAAIESRTDLVNSVTTQEAYKVEKEIKKIIDQFKKLAAYNDKSNAVKTRDFALVQAVRAILAEHGIGSKGESAQTYLDLVKKHDPAAGARLQEIVDVTSANPMHWTEIKIADLRELSEAIGDLWYSAARTRQMEVQGKMVDQAAIAAELLETLVEQGLPDRVPGQGWAPTKAEKRKMKFGALKAQWQRMEFIASKLDGNRAVGPWLKNVISVVQDALANMNIVKADVMTQYGELLDSIAPTLKDGAIDAPEIGWLFGKEGSGMMELMHAILHTGNESNLRKLLLGRGWAVKLQDGSMDTSKWDAFIARMIREGRLTKAHYDFAQGVWNLLDSLKIDAQKAHRTVFGKLFSEVTATSFTNQFGTYAGGYVPALTDSDVVKDREVEKLREAATSEMDYAFPSPAKGFTTARVEYNRELKLDLRSLGGHINQVLLFSHMAVPVNDIRKLLSRPEIAGAINTLYPGMIAEAINPWLVRVARNTVSPLATDMTRFLRIAKSRAGTNTMMGSVSNGVQQITGVIPATVAIDSKYLRHALVDVLSNTGETMEMVKELSVYMRTRIDNEVAAAMDNVEQILVNPNVYQSTVDFTRRHAYFLQSAVDNALSPTLWLAAYNQAKDKNPGMEDLDAVHIADALIRKTQGASGSADIATFEAGHPYVQLFTQFTGYFNMMAQFLQGEWVKNVAREVGLPSKFARAFYIVGIGFYAQAVAAELIALLFRGAVGGDDDDKGLIDNWLFQLGVMAPIKFVTATIPFLGSALMVGINKWNSKPYDDKMMNSPVISMLESTAGAPVDVYKAIFADGAPSKAVRSVGGAIGLFTGLPTAIAARPIGYLADVAAGKVRPTSAADAIRGTITGTASPDSKK